MNTALTKTHKVTDTLSTEACKVIGAALTEAFRQQMNNSLREKKKQKKRKKNGYNYSIEAIDRVQSFTTSSVRSFVMCLKCLVDLVVIIRVLTYAPKCFCHIHVVCMMFCVTGNDAADRR